MSIEFEKHKFCIDFRVFPHWMNSFINNLVILIALKHVLIIHDNSQLSYSSEVFIIPIGISIEGRLEF